MHRQYRQGDVLIISAEAPKKLGSEVARSSGKLVLALGEATGHHHRIEDPEATMHAMPGTGDRFLQIMNASGVTLVHEEHVPILIPPGDYLVRIQREYVPAAVPRRVMD